MFQESIRSTQWEIQHQKQHVKQHVKHWFFATVVAGAGKGNFQLPDTAAVSPFLTFVHVYVFIYLFIYLFTYVHVFIDDLVITTPLKKRYSRPLVMF